MSQIHMEFRLKFDAWNEIVVYFDWLLRLLSLLCGIDLLFNLVSNVLINTEIVQKGKNMSTSCQKRIKKRLILYLISKTYVQKVLYVSSIRMGFPRYIPSLFNHKLDSKNLNALCACFICFLLSSFVTNQWKKKEIPKRSPCFYKQII